MRTVVLGPRPPELEALLVRRRSLGLDGHDEVWEGEYHIAPAAHPQHGVVQAKPAKLDFYFRRGVGEVPIVDLARRTVTWQARSATGFTVAARSALLGLDGEALRGQLGWPAAQAG